MVIKSQEDLSPRSQEQRFGQWYLVLRDPTPFHTNNRRLLFFKMRSCRASMLLDFVLILLTAILAVQVQAQSSLPLPYRNVAQFSDPTYLEDLHVRNNGDILLTTVEPNGSIWLVTNVTSSSPKVSLIHTFPDLNGVTGLVETRPGIITLLAGNQVVFGVAVIGSWGVWELDMRNSTPSLREIVRIPEAGLLVGIVQVPNEPTSVLIADSLLGLVWRVDTLTGTLEIASKDENMLGPPWGATSFGINGLGIRDGYLYWTNSYIASIYRIPISDSGYTPIGSKSELVVAIRSIFIDNFTFGPGKNDTIWVATNSENQLLAITPEGKSTCVLGTANEMTVAGCGATAFGKLEGDKETLYVVTNGGYTLPINGTITEGGKLIAVETKAYFN